MNDVHLHIDALVLEGFDPRDRQRIADAVKFELARLLAERGCVPRAGARDVVDAGQFALPARPTPSAVGGLVAKQVHGALNHGR